MEKARPIIAIVLCLVIWGVYFKWFSPKTPPKKPAATPTATSAETPADSSKPKPPDNPPTELPPTKFTHPQVTPAACTLENNDLFVTLTTAGASVQSVILKKFRDPFDHEKPLTLLDEFQPGLRSLSMRDPSGAAPLDSVHWERQEKEEKTGEVVFRYTQPNGLVFTKTFSLGPEPHAIRLQIAVENLSEVALARSWELVGAAGILQEASGGVYPSGVRGLWKEGRTYSTEEEALKDLSEKPWQGQAGGYSWVGGVNKFFACVLVPLDRAHAAEYRMFPLALEEEFQKKIKLEGLKPGDPKAEKERDWTINTVGFAVRTAERTWQAKEKTVTEWVMFAGPKDDESLAAGRFADLRFGDLLDFGWFSFISRLLLWILGIFHFVFRNYGIAIILLVLVVRLAIFPISKKAQVSMFRMQKLQPQIKAVQEKFKGDPVRQNQESMKLMKEHGVNPLGGCLPLFLQIPVFLGLYNALLKDIHLRQEPFFGWIRDLSLPDYLFTLPFSILGTNEAHLLPIIMTATWFTQAYLAPRSPDPQMAAQQKIFMFMPLVIGFMMYNTPSGLVLYWLVSTAWGIGEQQLIKKLYLK